MLFQQFTDTNQEKAPGILAGSFCLLDNPMVCSKFLSFVAIKAGRFPTFEQWQKFLKADHKPPKKPDREDPFLYQNPDYIGRHDLEDRSFARAPVFESRRIGKPDDCQQADQGESKKGKAHGARWQARARRRGERRWAELSRLPDEPIQSSGSSIRLSPTARL